MIKNNHHGANTKCLKSYYNCHKYTHTHTPTPIPTFSPYIMLISNHNISRSKPMSSSLNVTSSFHNYQSKSNNIFISKIFIIVCNELMAFLDCWKKKKAISSDRQRERELRYQEQRSGQN